MLGTAGGVGISFRRQMTSVPGCAIICLRGLFALFVLIFLQTAQTAAAEALSAIDSVDVVLSDDFPPYSFPDADTGEAAGMLKDLWELWSEKTGIPVRLHVRPWGFLEPIEPYTVFGTAARTEAREAAFLFGPDPISVPMYLYADRETGGVTGVKDLRGRTVGVVGKGSCNNWLTANGVSTIEYYESFTDIVKATVAGRLSVFCSGQTAAIRYLSQYGQLDRFVRSPPAFTNDIHWIVKKDDGNLYGLVNAGFAAITREEHRQIKEHWLGKSLEVPWLAKMVRLAAYAAAAGLVLSLGFAVWNWMLRRQVEQRTAEFKAAKAEADKANKAKSEFLAAMSHDLRTPLNAIMGFSDMMRNRTFGPLGSHRYNEYVNDIYNSGSLLVSLINDVLDLSKIEAGKYDLVEETLSIFDVVDSSIRQVMPMSALSSVALNNEVSREMPNVYGDERVIIQVLNNLLSNAIKFTPAGGVVNVTAKLNTENGIVISVSDTGIGISGEEIEKALQPFEQADGMHSRHQEGTGLGLYLCMNMMKLFGGGLTIESQVHKGTTVSIYFPPQRTVQKHNDESKH